LLFTVTKPRKSIGDTLSRIRGGHKRYTHQYSIPFTLYYSYTGKAIGKITGTNLLAIRNALLMITNVTIPYSSWYVSSVGNSKSNPSRLKAESSLSLLTVVVVVALVVVDETAADALSSDTSPSGTESFGARLSTVSQGLC
jgi:hypothetical protein